MIGDFAVGKTSLVARFVHSTFSDRYLTTVGVKVDTKELRPEPGVTLKLVLWDIAGTGALSSVERSYLAGSAGYLLVTDGTRRQTLAVARGLHEQARRILGEVPAVLVLNKADLEADWELEAESRPQGLAAVRTSARSGEGVEEAFAVLARALVEA
jgi:small GTP-binding protein